MTGLVLASPAATAPPGLAHASFRDALAESRQRWRHLVSLAADLAFETDASGRFVLMMPDTALGWPAGSLIGQSSDRLVGPPELFIGTNGVTFNPFRPQQEVRRHRTWLRCGDGRLAIFALSATPLLDAAGLVTGARGIGIDITDSEAQSSEIAARLRRGQVLHYILSQVKQQTDSDSMMDTALGALVHALGAEGAAAVGALSAAGSLEVLHEYGPGASEVLEAATGLLSGGAGEPGLATNPDGRQVLAVGCETRDGVPAGLAIWRTADHRPWDQEDTTLAGAAVCIVRMVMDYEALQRELAHQASTDPLTGLFNRRAFIEEMRRDLVRLDRGAEAGTMLFVDTDAFKAVNDRLGHAVGDQVLIRLADILRRLVRPFDLIARLGGDEFVVWLSGADHMTAAERADHLCKTAPAELQAMLPEPFPKLGVSVGIATRRFGSQETVEDLMRRADLAMYEVKRGGRHHWRVSLLDGD
jgi:diguanylate cyclase (GGDEF)-like protein/PAS domain S-box-containing protein